MLRGKAIQASRMLKPEPEGDHGASGPALLLLVLLLPQPLVGTTWHVDWGGCGGSFVTARGCCCWSWPG